MPAKGDHVRQKTYVDGVPFTEVSLTNGETVRLYDTSGPGSEPETGLPPLRRPWIEARDDVEAYPGRRPTARDDGRRKPATSAPAAPVTTLRAKPGRTVTQLPSPRRAG